MCDLDVHRLTGQGPESEDRTGEQPVSLPSFRFVSVLCPAAQTKTSTVRSRYLPSNGELTPASSHSHL